MWQNYSSDVSDLDFRQIFVISKHKKRRIKVEGGGGKIDRGLKFDYVDFLYHGPLGTPFPI